MTIKRLHKSGKQRASSDLWRNDNALSVHADWNKKRHLCYRKQSQFPKINKKTNQNQNKIKRVHTPPSWPLDQSALTLANLSSTQAEASSALRLGSKDRSIPSTVQTQWFRPIKLWHIAQPCSSTPGNHIVQVSGFNTLPVQQPKWLLRTCSASCYAKRKMS